MDTSHATPDDALETDDELDLFDDEDDDLDDETEGDDPDDLDEEEDDDLAADAPGAALDGRTLPPLVARAIRLVNLGAERDRRKAAALTAQRKRRETSARRPRPKTAERPRCGARCRTGRPCVAPAVWLAGASKPRNGRCRMHGGLSTGPRTAEGRARVIDASRRASAARAAARRDSMSGAHESTRETGETPATPCCDARTR